MRISQGAFDLILEEEVSSRARYEKHYTHFDWPGGASGPTVGIGYDCGYSTAVEIDRDWYGIVDVGTVFRLQSAAGVKGRNATVFVLQHKTDVTITWDQATKQFRDREIPKWEERVLKLPNAGDLSPDSLGALVSLCYNRGEAWNVSVARDLRGRFREMRNIKAHMAARQFDKIPAELLSMRRLWVGIGLNGLLKRRAREAEMFKAGLANALA